MPAVIVQESRDNEIREAMLTIPGFDESADVILIKEPFVANRATDIPSLVVATFPGSGLRASGVPVLFKDVESGKWWIYFPEPEGGWVWTRSAGAGDLETIYGFKVGAVACALITPRAIAVEGDTVVIGDIYVPIEDLLANVG